jgi:hypothetical protein
MPDYSVVIVTRARVLRYQLPTPTGTGTGSKVETREAGGTEMRFSFHAQARATDIDGKAQSIAAKDARL